MLLELSQGVPKDANKAMYLVKGVIEGHRRKSRKNKFPIRRVWERIRYLIT